MNFLLTKTIIEHQQEEIDKINSLAGDKILAKYPIYKQNNYLARSIELQSLGLVGNPEWLEIQTIWAWVKTIRTASNISVTEIQTATDVLTMRASVTSFIAFLNTL